MFQKKKADAAGQKNGSVNIVGDGTSIQGSLNTKGDIRIDGKVNGDVSSKAKVVIGETGEVEGNIYSHEAEISGKVIGNVEIVETLFLKASATLKGNIISNKLVIENGADFNGYCQTGVSQTKSIFDGRESTTGNQKEATA